MKKVIFACVHNAGRSQMAAAFFNKFADAEKAIAISAGTEPGKSVHPIVLDIMNEIGMDLSKAIPTRLTGELSRDCYMLVTMGCGEKCPYLPGVLREDWLLEDPKDKPILQVRIIRDDILNRVKSLIEREEWD